MAIKKTINLKEIPDADLEAEFLRRYREDLTAEEYSPEQMSVIFNEVGSIEHFEAMLKSIIAADRVRFFNASPEQQPTVRGATLRTIWILKSIRNTRKKSS